MKLKLVDLMFRAWFYLRLGYGTYLGFIVGFVTFVASTYYLAIKNLPFFETIFTHFYAFVIVSLAVILPVSILIGWFHMKRTLAYPTDAAIGVESNPYTYITAPGKEEEISWPAFLLILRTLQKIMEKENMLSTEEKNKFESIQAKIETLLEGGVVGRPKQRTLIATSRKRGT